MREGAGEEEEEGGGREVSVVGDEEAAGVGVVREGAAGQLQVLVQAVALSLDALDQTDQLSLSSLLLALPFRQSPAHQLPEAQALAAPPNLRPNPTHDSPVLDLLCPADLFTLHVLLHKVYKVSSLLLAPFHCSHRSQQLH